MGWVCWVGLGLQGWVEFVGLGWVCWAGFTGLGSLGWVVLVVLHWDGFIVKYSLAVVNKIYCKNSCAMYVVNLSSTRSKRTTKLYTGVQTTNYL